MTRFILARRALLGSVLVAPSITQAQTRRPLRIIIPFPPGGAVDSLGRILADRLAPVLEQQVVVENRSGAGGMIGADAVAKAAPDGTTIGIIGAATLCAAPFLLPSMPFDVARDFRPLTQITDSAIVLAVGAPVAAARNWTSLAALLDWARANPGRFNLANAGVATVSHLVSSALAKEAGVEFNMIPYRGGAQAANDMLAGTLDGSADLPSALIPLAQGGRVKLLGVSSGRRLALLPEVPAFAETPGLGAIDVRSWNMMLLPAGTPDAEALRLFGAIRQVAGTPGFRDALRPLGYDVVTSASLEAASALVRDETPRWRRLVEVSGARVD